MPPLENPPVPDIGVESMITTTLPNGAGVRARFRLSSSRAAPFPAGDWRAVRISARVFDPQDVQRDTPLGEGAAKDAVARTDWSVVDLELPPMLRGRYSVQAKVYSADDRYRRLFMPSNCRPALVEFGDRLRVDRSILEDVYASRTGNPLAEEQIRRHVRGDQVEAVDEQGRRFRATEVEGRIDFEPLGP